MAAKRRASPTPPPPDTELDSKVEKTVNKFQLSRRNARSLIFHVITDPTFQNLLRHQQAGSALTVRAECTASIHQFALLWSDRHDRPVFAAILTAKHRRKHSYHHTPRQKKTTTKKQMTTTMRHHLTPALIMS